MPCDVPAASLSTTTSGSSIHRCLQASPLPARSCPRQVLHQQRDRLWSVRVSPMSSPSIADGRVFTVEKWNDHDADRLAARSMTDGHLEWARALADARGPAPLLAGSVVVVHTRDGVHAFDRATGGPVWTAPLPRTADPVQSATTLAAAMGTRTLVVVSGSSVHVVDLDDGHEQWAGTPLARARTLDSPVIVGKSLYLVADGKAATTRRFDRAVSGEGVGSSASRLGTPATLGPPAHSRARRG